MLLAGALFLLDRSSSARLSGEAITGGTTSVGTQLQQASLLVAKDPAGALRLYDEVIASNPDQPVALTAEGWIYAEAGFVTKGMGLLARAEKADPGYDLPHLYQGLVLLDDEGEAEAAASQFEWYLSHGPQPGTSATAKAGLELARAEA
jgi:tetratricopeptide (TPR) repeat protein